MKMHGLEFKLNTCIKARMFDFRRSRQNMRALLFVLGEILYACIVSVSSYWSFSVWCVSPV